MNDTDSQEKLNNMYIDQLKAGAISHMIILTLAFLQVMLLSWKLNGGISLNWHYVFGPSYALVAYCFSEQAILYVSI